MTVARRSGRLTRTVLGALVALSLTAGLTTPAAAGWKFSDILVSGSAIAGAHATGEPGPTADPSAVQKVREALQRQAEPAQP